MDLGKIKKLLSIVAASDVSEVEIEEEGLRVVVRKSPSTNAVPQQAAPFPPLHLGYFTAPTTPAIPAPTPGQVPEAAAGDQVSPRPAGEAEAAPADVPAQAAPEQEGEIIRAPIVGTFYRSPSPDSDPFVRVGDRVQPGDVLCIIEAMKLMNEIECETSGIVRRIFVENAEPVEFDQPLFLIESE